MSLIEKTLYGTFNKVEIAIQRIKAFEPPEGYFLAYSGGKDSTVILELAKRAGVKFDAHYNVTTIDPPELVQFVKSQDGIAFDRPTMTYEEMLLKKAMPPTRICRWCCALLKEGSGYGRFKMTGIRAEESSRRAKRKMTEQCYNKKSWFLHPIIDWTTEEVWDFIKSEKLEYCKLYDEGKKRIGCICCPFSGGIQMRIEGDRYPKMKARFIRMFDKITSERKRRDMKPFLKGAGGKEIWDWWTSDRKQPEEQEGGLFT